MRRRPATDLGLWLPCSGGLFAVVAIGMAADPPRGRPIWFDLAAATLGCTVVGWTMHAGLINDVYRLTRRKRDDQAEDYGDHGDRGGE